MPACCVTPTAVIRPPLAIGLLFSTIVAIGCGNDAAILPGDVRTYRTPRGVDVTAAAPRGGARPEAATASRVRYDLPEGWADGGAGGLRLATLLIGAGADRQEVTVIPASGTLENNVARWVGQLDASVDEAGRQRAAAKAIADGKTVDVDGSPATVVLLLDPTAAAGDEDGEAILGAMVPVEGSSSLFVKFKGRADVARRERENFHRFVSSLRWN
jgi:hypothetical protein